VFGGRRSTTVPLVYQARDWEHGTAMGATMTSETTAAAAGKRGVLRNDPFAMRPFCGYNMGDYFSHWLSFQRRTSPAKLPKIFHVNWFRKNKAGKFMWPGFGDNIRVLEWILGQCDAENPLENAVDSPLGFIPRPGSINMQGLENKVSDETMEELFSVEPFELGTDIAKNREFVSNFGNRVPEPINKYLDDLESRVEELYPH
jgi:phosphoenolpyruvate carboxykinase (GTP)